MGQTGEPDEPAATEQSKAAVRPEQQRSTQLQERLKVFRHQRALLLEAILSAPDAAYTDLFSGELDFQRLLNAVPLQDISIDCRNDSNFDLPKVINFLCKRRDTFNFFLRLFENRETPDRLFQAVVHAGFKAVSLKYEREEVFLLLRLDPDHQTFRLRDQELRAVLNPLFRDHRVVLQGDLLARYISLLQDSERLRTRALAMDWQVHRTLKTLTLVPLDSCDRDEAIESFQLFLFSRPRKSPIDQLHDVLVALFRGEALRVPRSLEAEFMGALRSWDLLLKLCRGRVRRRDAASGDLIMEVARQVAGPPQL